MRRAVATTLTALTLAAGCSSGNPNDGTPIEVADSPRAAATGACAGVPGVDTVLAPGPASTADPALPDVTLPCLNSGQFPLRRLTGTPTVVTLWGSWCAPCREELPAFERFGRAAAGKVRVVGVDTEDPPGRGASLATDLKLTFPHVVDTDGAVKRALRRNLMPSTAFVAADGRLAYVYSGTPLTDATLRAMVRDKLGVTVP